MADHTSLDVAGKHPLGRWRAKLTGHVATTTIVLAVFAVLWYWNQPDTRAFPLMIFCGVVGYIMGRAVSQELLAEKDKEIDRRDREIDRMAAHKEKLESRLLTQRASSKKPRAET